MALINLQIGGEDDKGQSEMTKYEKNLLRIISTSPGAEASGVQIYEKLLAEAKVSKWFGKDSFLAAVFGPSPGRLYIALWDFEEKGVLESRWGVATAERDGHRLRYYKLKQEEECQAMRGDI